MQSCTECFQKYSSQTIKEWKKDHIQFYEDPFICPYCWDLLHEEWANLEDVNPEMLPRVEE